MSSLVFSQIFLANLLDSGLGNILSLIVKGRYTSLDIYPICNYKIPSICIFSCSPLLNPHCSSSCLLFISILTLSVYWSCGIQPRKHVLFLGCTDCSTTIQTGRYTDQNGWNIKNNRKRL